jgi:hypothetical protein
VSFDIDAALVGSLDDVFLRYPGAVSDVGPTLTFIADRRTPEPSATPRTFFFGLLNGSADHGKFTLASNDVRVELNLAARHVHAVAAHASDELRTGGLVALSLALRLDGLHHLHAAAATTAAGTKVLLVGESGSGKTTTLLGLVAAGAKPTADDVVFLQRQADGVRILGHPRTYHLTPDAFARFPNLAHARVDAGAIPPKVAIDPRLVPGLAGPSALEAIDVIAFPRVAGARTEVRAIPAADAFTALLTQSAFGVLPGAPGLRDQLDLLASLVKRSRCVELRLAEDALIQPVLLAALLDGARSA